MPPSLSWTDPATLARLTARIGGASGIWSSPGASPASSSSPGVVMSRPEGARVRFPGPRSTRPLPPARSSSSSRPSSSTAAISLVRTSSPPLPAPASLAAARERPSFKSVELDVTTLGADFAALHTPPLTMPPPLSMPPPTGPLSALAMPPVQPLPRLTAEPAFEVPPYEEVELPALAGSSSIPTPSVSLSNAMQGSLPEKLELFLHWLMGSTGAYAAFVADEDGLPLSNRHTTEDLIAICAVLDKTAREVSHLLEEDPEGSLSFELDADNVLHVTWVVTPAGRFAIGVVIADVLERKLVHSIRKSFRALST